MSRSYWYWPCILIYYITSETRETFRPSESLLNLNHDGPETETKTGFSNHGHVIPVVDIDLVFLYITRNPKLEEKPLELVNPCEILHHNGPETVKPDSQTTVVPCQGAILKHLWKNKMSIQSMKLMMFEYGVNL